MELPAFYGCRKDTLCCPYLVENPLKFSEDPHEHGLQQPYLAYQTAGETVMHYVNQNETFGIQSVASVYQQDFVQMT